ncbi:MAG: hypothetical protein IPL49_21820 [Saprospirales bacterium]|nr:hypothetical protein [Saprospirales bacterium]MBK8493435.1 hypothetical protein [Saprospirales bacterium]
MSTLSILVWLFFMGKSASFPAQSVTFQVVYKDRTIGEMVAIREQIGNQEIYHNTTNIRTRIIIRQVELQYQSRVVFMDGILQEATVHSLLNGVNETVETRKVGNAYSFFKNGKLKRTLDGPITYSALKMIFEEPVGISVVYSEEAGDFNAIKSNELTKYSKINSKGRTNYYYYEEQFLKKIEINTGLVKVEMIRKQ